MNGIDTPVGFIGTGIMGAPMARRLAAAGFPLTVWNRNRSKLAPVLEAGAREAGSPAGVAAASEVVFLCLTDATGVEACAFGADGVTSGGRSGTILVDCSSISPEATRGFAARASEVGITWIDAPVSGGAPGAEAGTLAVMAGGQTEAVERVRPIVMHFASRLTHVGPTGAGQTVKLCNQVIVGCTMAILAEAGRLAENAGLNPDLLPEALAGGFADSKPLQIFLPRMVNALHDPPLGHVYTMLKDLDSVTALARSVGSPVPFTALAAEQFRLLKARGGEETDALAIYKLSGKTPL